MHFQPVASSRRRVISIAAGVITAALVGVTAIAPSSAEEGSDVVASAAVDLGTPVPQTEMNIRPSSFGQNAGY